MKIKASTNALSSLHPKQLQVLHLIIIERLVIIMQKLSRTTLKIIFLKKTNLKGPKII